MRPILPIRSQLPRTVAIGLLLAAVACAEAPGSGDVSDGVVFVQTNGGRSDLAQGRIADGQVRALTDTANRQESWPYWSPRGRRLIFQTAGSGDETSRSDLVLWDPKTRSETPLVATPGRDARWPHWSPDGRRVAFAFRGGRPRAGLGIAELATGKLTVVAASNAREHFLRPHFSPDGNRLVAQRRGAAGVGSKLWIVARGGEPRPLTLDAAWFDMKPWFTRDGSHVLFSRRPASGGSHDIARVKADGSDLRVLASRPDADDHSARPSPRRDEFAFVSDRTGNYEVYVADASGRDVHRLTHTPDHNEFAPSWSPDGQRLLVIAIDKRFGTPRLTEPASLEHVTVRVLDRSGNLLFEASGYNPDWMPPWP